MSHAHAFRGGAQDHGTAAIMAGHDRRYRSVKQHRRAKARATWVAGDLRITDLDAMADTLLESAGFDNVGGLIYTRSSWSYDAHKPVVIEPDESAETPHFDLIALGYSKPWMEAKAEDLGLSWTPRLRRTTVIDEVDPTEALDNQNDFVGLHMTTHP